MTNTHNEGPDIIPFPGSQHVPPAGPVRDVDKVFDEAERKNTDFRPALLEIADTTRANHDSLLGSTIPPSPYENSEVPTISKTTIASQPDPENAEDTLPGEKRSSAKNTKPLRFEQLESRSDSI